MWRLYVGGSLLVLLTACDLVADFNDGVRERVIGPPDFYDQRELERQRREQEVVVT